MSDLPWVRFFPSDWLGGTRGMSAAETGVYITLIASMYERCEPIPEDHARLARLCGASNSAFKATLETLVAEGKIRRVDGGLWNDRVEKEGVYRLEKSEVGKQAADARWRKTKENQEADDANAMQMQCERNANQKPEPEPEIARKKLSSEDEFAAWYDAYPRHEGKGQARKAYATARKKASPETLLAGARAASVRYATSDRQFVPLPATWLNGERWLDETQIAPRVVARNWRDEPEYRGVL